MLKRLLGIGENAGKYLRYTLEWRVIATATDFTVIYLVTGKLKEATSLAIILVVLKSTFFYFWRRYRQ